MDAPTDLYNIKEDPGESKDLSVEWPGAHRAFVDLFEKHKG
jgi:hypothetical protein